VDVKTIVLPPPILTEELGALLLVLCDNEVAMPIPEEVSSADEDDKLAGVE